jgi:hypothetical protein
MVSMETPAPKNRRWQFTIRTLLFVMFCVSGLLGGFQVGYHYGSERRRDESFYTVVYSIEGLPAIDQQTQQPDLGQFVELICHTIAPETWQVVGGMATVSALADGPPSLIVNQTRRNHEAVADLLEQLRAAKGQSQVSSP